jgi:hypothetical protein
VSQTWEEIRNLEASQTLDQSKTVQESSKALHKGASCFHNYRSPALTSPAALYLLQLYGFLRLFRFRSKVVTAENALVLPAPTREQEVLQRAPRSLQPPYTHQHTIAYQDVHQRVIGNSVSYQQNLSKHYGRLPALFLSYDVNEIPLKG